MKKILSYIKILSPFVIVALFAKLIGVALLIFLPYTSLEKDTFIPSDIDFRNYKLNKALGFSPSKEKVVKIKEKMYDLKDLALKAVYKDNHGGIVIVVDIKTKEATVLSKGESIRGYKLIEIYSKYVIFSKNKKRYTLKLYDNLNIQDTITKKIQKNNLVVSKKDLMKYATNFNSIWRNISIEDVKKNKKIIGFKITYIRRKSIFGKLGLKKGDIIIRVNSQPITNYAQAFKIYNNIKYYDYLEVTVLRNGKEKDLDYEIQ